MIRQIMRAVCTCNNSADYVFRIIEERTLKDLDHHGLYEKYERQLQEAVESEPLPGYRDTTHRGVRTRKKR